MLLCKKRVSHKDDLRQWDYLQGCFQDVADDCQSVERSLSRMQWTFNSKELRDGEALLNISLKRCLRTCKTIGRGRLTLDELLTAIVKSRLLSYVLMDSIQELTTLSHLLTDRWLMSPPDGPYNTEVSEDVSVVPSNLSRSLIHLNTIFEHFWKRWKREYLLELRESHRHAKHPPEKSHCSPIAVGEMVLVHEDRKPRGFWKLAKVVSLITGADGITRDAVVKIPSSVGRPITLRRPLQLLYPLEVSRCDGDVMPLTSATPSIAEYEP